MSLLKPSLGKRVRVITTDARLFEGVLESFDNATNVVISGTVEKVIYPDEDNEILPLGVYLLRGGNIVCVGEVDDNDNTDWKTINGDNLKDTRNPL